jgi:hypothetical protein
MHIYRFWLGQSEFRYLKAPLNKDHLYHIRPGAVMD